jgi:hypothetical protein
MKAFLRLIPVLALLGCAQVRGNVAATVALARSVYGPEATLSAVRSIRYVGTAETTLATPEGPRPFKAQIEIVFQVPFRQRMVVTLEDRVEVTALDDYEAWQRVVDPADPTRWRLTLLEIEQIKRLRATTWENLAFHRGLEQRGGRLEDLGDATVDGVRAHKIAFLHDNQIIFFRYFDRVTGRLLLTETDQGERIREEGELMASGIRFSRKVITTKRLPDGSDRVVAVTFDQITVNETFPATEFSLPPVGRP